MLRLAKDTFGAARRAEAVQRGKELGLLAVTASLKSTISNPFPQNHPKG